MLEAEVVERLDVVSGVAARATDKLRQLLALENVAEQVSFASWLQLIFNPIKEEIQEFLRVLLLPNDRRPSIHFFEGKAEVFRIEGVSVTQLQSTEHFLELPEQVIVNHVSFELHQVFFGAVFSSQKLVSELRYHIKLLKHRNHVANASKVVDTNILSKPPLRSWSMLESFWTFNVLDQRHDPLLYEFIHLVGFQVLNYGVQRHKRGVASVIMEALAFVFIWLVSDLVLRKQAVREEYFDQS